jgi:hypothetical protein
MTQDNFDIISSLLQFNSLNDFYFLQIVKRKKENPTSKSSTIIKTYYIDSLAYFNLKKEEIIYLCKIHNARAYINLNRRGFEEVGEQALKRIVDHIISKQYKAIRNTYDLICGKFDEDEHEPNYLFNSANTELKAEEKRWIVDIDTLDPAILNATKEAIMKCTSQYPVQVLEKTIYKNIIAEIPTINGVHLITHPFNSNQLEPFLVTQREVSILKNSFTLLYYSNDI